MSAHTAVFTWVRDSMAGKAVVATLAVAAAAGSFAACSAGEDVGSSEAEFRGADNGGPQRHLPYFNR